MTTARKTKHHHLRLVNEPNPSVETAQALREYAEAADMGELTGAIIIVQERSDAPIAPVQFKVAGTARRHPDRALGLVESCAVLLKETVLKHCGVLDLGLHRRRASAR